MFISKNMFLSLKIDVHNLCTSARPRNIRWILKFLDQVRSSRNIMTYVHQPDQEAEEHKVGPYVPRPSQILEERNDLCSSARSWSWGTYAQFVNPARTSMFFRSSPLSCTSAPCSPCTGHPVSSLPTHWPPRPCLAQPGSASPRPCADRRPRPAPLGPSRWRPVPASSCSSSESRAPLCIKFFSLIKINKFMCHAKNRSIVLFIDISNNSSSISLVPKAML
jgi:hypothetical protein